MKKEDENFFELEDIEGRFMAGEASLICPVCMTLTILLVFVIEFLLPSSPSLLLFLLFLLLLLLLLLLPFFVTLM
jgi:hypothetical protein